MTEYVNVRVTATVSARIIQTISVPKEIWEDCDFGKCLWGDRADRFIRENLDGVNGDGGLYWDESDVDVDDARLAAPAPAEQG